MLYFNLLENIYPLQIINKMESVITRTKTSRNVEAIDMGGYLYRRDRQSNCRDV